MKRTELRRTGPATTAVKPLKPKTCSKVKGGCGEKFTPARQMQAACGPRCAEAFALKISAKAAAIAATRERKATADQRDQLKSLSVLASEAQKWVNAYVRLRDNGQGCISCGTHTAEAWHAGHYLSRGARPELRFDLDNIHLQCMQCNYFGGGMAAAYRVRLVEKIGFDRVDRLEGPHPPLKLTRENLRAMRAEYRAKAKQLESRESHTG